MLQLRSPATHQSTDFVGDHRSRSSGTSTTGLLLALAGLVTIAGCTVGPAYEPVKVDTNPAWIDAPQVPPTAAADGRWWSGFQDEALSKLIERAMSQNLSLRTAGLRVIEARALRGVAAGRFFPQSQSATGSVSDRQNSANTPQAQGDRSYNDAAVGVQAVWELDFWGRFRRAIEAADAQLQLTVADYDSVMVSLGADVATQYLQIRSLQERIGFAEANVKLQSDTLGLTDVRFQAGKVSELDVVSARTTLATTRALVPELRASLRQALLSLAVLLGQNPTLLEQELAVDQPKLPEPPATIAAGVPAELLRRRPDLRSAERAVAQATANVGVAVADLYPTVSISGNTGFASASLDNARNPKINNLFDASSFTGFIGLSVNWPILNYGRIENNIRASDARLEQARVTYQQRVLSAAAEVETALYSFTQGKERSIALADAVSAAQRSVELAQIQYRNGAADFLRLNDAQSSLVLRQDALVASRASVALAAVGAYRALGGGWETRTTPEFIDRATVERMRARTDWGDVLDVEYAKGSDLWFDRTPADRAGASKSQAAENAKKK